MKYNTTRKLKKLEATKVDSMAKTMHQLLVRDLRGNSMRALPADAAAYVTTCQNTAFLKKFLFSGTEIGLREKSFLLFDKVNSHMLEHRVELPVQTRLSANNDEYDSVLLRARQICHELLTPLGEDEFFLSCKNSSGTSLGVPFSDTSIESKFSFPITVTRDALPFLGSYLAYDKELSLAVVNYNSTRKWEKVFEVVDGSRATTVPKNNDIDRMIAVEPTGNMFLQQGLMRCLYKRMDRWSLSVDSLPDRHKAMARMASIYRNFATIDFSSASDCLSIKLLKYLLPSTWFSVLNSVRCSHMSFNDTLKKLNMFSTMGNATTFPLETIVFYSLALASDIYTRNPRAPAFICYKPLMRNVSVFGDDCIVPTASAPLFMRMAVKVGFLVNIDKSFFLENDGFRESCGGDYLRGQDVRPFNLKRPATTKISSIESWLYTVCNAILEKYRMYFGSLTYLYDKHVLRYLFSLFRRYDLYIKIVPPDYPEDSGLRSLDLARLQQTYDLSFSKLQVDKHGSVSFLYKRFIYRSKKAHDDHIRYATAQKQCALCSYYSSKSRPTPERIPFVPIRRIGGYVVARGHSAHWAP